MGAEMLKSSACSKAIHSFAPAENFNPCGTIRPVLIRAIMELFMIQKFSGKGLYIISWIFIAASCRHFRDTAATTSGIDITQQSLAVTRDLRGRPVTSLDILPSTAIPKALMITLTEVTAETVESIYDIIYHINKRDGLRGIDGPSQEITLVTVTPDQRQFDQLSNRLRVKFPNIQERPAKVPYLEQIIAPVDMDIWMQDWGEVARVTVADYSKPIHAVLDTGRGFLYSDRTIEVFATTLGLPFVRVPLKSRAMAGSYGGNIDATPDGTIVIGDSYVNEDLLTFLRDLGHGRRIELPTSWLQTRHIDEYITFVPSKASPCGSAIVLGSPLDGLTTLASSDANEASASGLPSPLAVQESLNYFSRAGQGNGYAGTLEGYDADRPIRGPRWAIDMLVRSNLRAEKAIRSAEARLINAPGICAQTIVRLPQFFQRDASQDEGGGTSPQREEEAAQAAETFTNLAAFMPNALNMVVLRDHVIISNQQMGGNVQSFKPFVNLIQKRLGPVLGKPENIHFVDTSAYEARGGGIHCGTNVIREL